MKWDTPSSKQTETVPNRLPDGGHESVCNDRSQSGDGKAGSTVPVAVWVYPWTLQRTGVREALEKLSRIGVSRLNLAAHYHSICTVEPRDGIRYDRYPGGCFFEPAISESTDCDASIASDRSEARSIEPHINEVPGMEDPLGEICRQAPAFDVEIAAWTVCFHNTHLASRYPEYRPVDAFGNELTHGLCPSNRPVREYFRRIVRRLADYEIDRIDLESIGFPTALHGHGEEFGHLNNFSVHSDAGEFLLSLCFCQACRRTAKEQDVPIESAREVVRDVLESVVTPGPKAVRESKEPSDLVESYPSIGSLLEVRQQTIEEFIAGLAAVSSPVPLHYYVADGLGREPRDGFVAGVDLEAIGPHLESVTALYYTDDERTLEDRAEAIRGLSGVPVDIGVTMDPSVSGSQTEWESYSEFVLEQDPNAISVYNYSLMTDEHVTWLDTLTNRVKTDAEFEDCKNGDERARDQ